MTKNVENIKNSIAKLEAEIKIAKGLEKKILKSELEYIKSELRIVENANK